MEKKHWADKIAEKLIKDNLGKKEYVCAAGITPSGIVHIGNFRDIITSDFVVMALKDKKKKAKLLFFWDDFDRLRKIPLGVPQSFSRYIGMPISKVPDPYNCHDSYAQHFKADFENSISKLGVNVDFISQTKEHSKNVYYMGIKTAMQKRKEIAKILADFKTQGMNSKEIEEFYPLQVYCSKCWKDSTKIIDYDGENMVSYSCECGYKETADISKKNIGKLLWKVDWPMRWKYKNVCFEPGGVDHATQGGSYTVSKKIAEKIFEINPPFFQGYEFVGIKGVTKMSSSAGTGISPKDLLEIYEPAMLRWFFARTRPKAPISFNFDFELIRQYDEWDILLDSYFDNKISNENKRILFFSKTSKKEFAKKRIPFRQLTSFGQVVQGNVSQLIEMYKRLNQKYTKKDIEERLEKSQNWINKYADSLKIKVRETPNEKYFAELDESEKEMIKKLKSEMSRKWNIDELTKLIYEIPKSSEDDENLKKKKQREFFKHVYQLLINCDTGPRLPTFMLALGKNKIDSLLDFE